MSAAVSPAAVMRAMALAARLRDEIGDGDDQLLAGVLEGETDIFEILDKLSEVALADKMLVDRGKERLDRIKAREERTRDVIARILLALEIKKVERPLVTLTMTDGKQSAQIVDQSAVPAGYWRRSLDMVEISKQLRGGADIPGAVLKNGSPTLTMRSR